MTVSQPLGSCGILSRQIWYTRSNSFTEQREQAGLARPGASNSVLRIPQSPFRRSPSQPSLSPDFMADGGRHKESLAELWSDFLEREAQEGANAASRRGSEISPRQQGGGGELQQQQQ